MAIDYYIENKCVITTGIDDITFQDLLKFQQCIAADQSFRSDFNELVNFTQATTKELSPEDLKALANISPFGHGSKRAFIMPNDLSFGLSRMYRVFQEPNGAVVSVFRTVLEANAWLSKHP